MTFLCLRRPACCVPVVLSLWVAGSAPAIGAESATISPPTLTPMGTTLDATMRATTRLAADDPAAPDAPSNPHAGHAGRSMHAGSQ
ncbi:hypothetical protein [Pandoraea sp. NPDC087047]|uniref:hypothetical protein n=1 Tax=Pandoraea sp. NPDC087047 TaxID=3364390 RepID=UPI00381F1F73